MAIQGRSDQEIHDAGVRGLRGYRWRVWRGRIIWPLFWLALGGATSVFALPLFPSSAREWIERAQDKVVETKEGVVDTIAQSDTEAPGPTVISKPASTVNAQDALDVVREFLKRFNAYDERGLERITSPAHFPDVRTSMLVARGLNSKIHALRVSIARPCTNTVCEVRVASKVSGGLAFFTDDGEGGTTLIVRLSDGKLIVAGER